MLARVISEKIKKLIFEGYDKDTIIIRIKKEYGNVGSISFWYDICYNTVCNELGINRKKGEELKPKKVKLRMKR